MNYLMRAKLNSLVKASGGVDKKRFQLLLDMRHGAGKLFAHKAVDATIPENPLEIYHTTVVHKSVLGDLGIKEGFHGKVVTFQIVVDHGMVRVYLSWNGQRVRVFAGTLDNLMSVIIKDQD